MVVAPAMAPPDIDPSAMAPPAFMLPLADEPIAPPAFILPLAFAPMDPPALEDPIEPWPDIVPEGIVPVVEPWSVMVPDVEPWPDVAPWLPDIVPVVEPWPDIVPDCVPVVEPWPVVLVVLLVVWAAAEPAKSAIAAAAVSIRVVFMVRFPFPSSSAEGRQALTISGPATRRLPRFTIS